MNYIEIIFEQILQVVNMYVIMEFKNTILYHRRLQTN